jgi:hypothetical protein
MIIVTTPAHNNQQLFSDYYLDHLLPERQDWQKLAEEARSAMEDIAAIFKAFKRGDKEAQTEYRLVRPILERLGHTFEVQPSLATPQGTKAPDYVFYRDEELLNENKGKRLTDALLKAAAFAVGDAKYWDCPLDRALRSGKSDSQLLSNKNPSYQIAFYIQHSGLEWGILTNGRLWRLYHTSSAHKLDHYYEVDLPALLASGQVTNFLYFYAFFRRAAFDAQPIGVSAILKESVDYMQGVSDALNKQVYEALRHVAQGFLDFPPNQLSADNAADLQAIYDNSLILLYRLLFILYAEARNLLPLKDNDLYRTYYSMYMITHNVAETIDDKLVPLPTTAKLTCDLWPLFDFINEGNPPLNIATFNGGLFDPERHSFLERYRVGDAHLQAAIDMLARTSKDRDNEKHFIDYRDLSERHLGTIYEGLLEYHLETIAENDGWTVDLLNDKGERKASGSYYTPDYIVKYIVDATIGPLLQQAASGATAQEKVDAILAIKVLDPSMGSGHFLVEATEYIARFLVELNVQPEGVTREAELSYWKRRVVQSCIYGVDLNPLAVELAKLSLWLSTIAKDRPLSFLDHHLRAGNSLFGARFADLATARNGNGNGAKRKSKKLEIPKEQLSFFGDDAFRQSMTTAVDLMWLVEGSPALTVEQVKQQEQLYATMREGLIGKYGKLANMLTASYFGLSIDNTLWKPLADFATGRAPIAPEQFSVWIDAAESLAAQRGFFHWELEFPEVFFDRFGQDKGAAGGFDAVVGNPPWIRQETFSADKPTLERLYRVYHGVADLSTYFVELGNTFLKAHGRFGFIVHNKFVRANYGAPLRHFLRHTVHLDRLVNFGDLPVFHDAITYPMIVLTSKEPPDEAPVSYTLLDELHPDPAALAADIALGESTIPASAFSEEHWHLEGVDTQAILEKLRENSIPLGEYVNGNMYRGILTGLNEAFVIDQLTRDRLIAEDFRSREIIKPFVVGRDIKRYRVNYEKRYVIFTKRGIDLARYTAIQKYLEQYKTQLEPKPSDWDEITQGEWPGRKPGPYQWYEIQDTIAYVEAFENPKIIYPDIANSCQFAYDTTGLYSGNTTYIIPAGNDPLYLLALLNSSLIEFFFQQVSALIRGDYLRFFTQYVAQTPIRNIVFTTPDAEREALVKAGTMLVEEGREDALLAFIEKRLAQEPEQSDVVHDLLVYMAQQMIDLHRQRHEKYDLLLLALHGYLSRTEMQKLERLWTPSPLQAGEQGALSAKKEAEIAEAQTVLGQLAARQLNLSEHLGLLNEDQWVWLIKRRLNGIARKVLPDLVETFRQRQTAVAALEERIAMLDQSINEVVYRLYELSTEEMRMIRMRMP